MTSHLCPSYPCPYCHASAIETAKEQLMVNVDYLAIVPNWYVTLSNTNQTFQVSQDNLKVFLEVLAHNNLEFDVKRDKNFVQEITG